MVHHGEHVGQSFVGLSHQVANRTFFLAIAHHSSRAAMNPELVFKRKAFDVVART